MRLEKSFLICLIAGLLVFVFAGCANLSFNEEPENSGSSVSEEEIEYTEDYYDRLFFNDVVLDETVRENIFAALREINIDTEDIENFEKIEDETGTEKYRFDYARETLIVSMDEDSTVYSIKIGENGEEVYLKGYESYDIEDYTLPLYMSEMTFYGMLENAIEISFDYPESFEITDNYDVKRFEDYYIVTAGVTVEGSEKEHIVELTCYYSEEENTFVWSYLVVDGKANQSFNDKYVKPERQQDNDE